MEYKSMLQNIQKLRALLDTHADKRVVVVGTTCTGKSNFLKYITNAHDMDKLVFPQLTKEKAAYVDSTPWTEQIGKTMIRLVRDRVKVTPGRPVFGTVVIDSGLIVYLHINDELLRQRIVQRGVNFEDAKNMQRQIEEEIKESGIPSITFPVG